MHRHMCNGWWGVSVLCMIGEMDISGLLSSMSISSHN